MEENKIPDQDKKLEDVVSDSFKNTECYKLLNDIEIDGGIIDPSNFIRMAERIDKIQLASDANLAFEAHLNEALTTYKKRCNKELTECANLSRKQEELNQKIAKKMDEREQVKSQLSEYETQRQVKTNYDLERLKEQLKELQESIRKEEEKEMLKLKAELDQLESQNKKRREEIDELKKGIEKGNDELKKLRESKDVLEQEIKKKNKEIETSKNNLSNKRSDKEGEKKECYTNKSTLEKCEQNNKNCETLIQDIKNKMEDTQKNIKAMEKKKGELDKQIEELNKDKANTQKEIKSLTKKKAEFKDQLTKLSESKKNKEIQKARKVKLLEDTKEKLKKQESEINTNNRKKTILLSKIAKENDHIQEEENNSAKQKIILNKCNEEMNKLMSDLQKIQEKIDTENQNKETKEQFKKECNESKENLQKDYKELEQVEKNIIQKADKTKERIEEIKAKKESIMRTKERLDEKTAMINEEIKIKELIFLDMTKKYEELKHMYNKYNVLYKTVQAERNNNVVKIQNSNQNRAQLKEKMRILTTEMDILDANLAETYNEMNEKDKDLNKMSTKSNSLKQEINMFGLKNLKYKEEITKLTNENEKLHSIINAIENEMVNFRKDYERNCESRNYTGIQLIDRNDELCIFYEKIHHIEEKISDLYKVILEKEAVLKRSVVEVNEIQRFIEVNRKKIPEIPELSNKIKELQTELDILNETLNKLIDDVENPENNLKVELPGEEPDITYLRNKYSQLTDMLNEKKEKLLEKELINDEINEIAEKLRKKALADRGNNLEISKKINEYEIKLNNNTRQTIAFTSELSMFQAILTRLENSKKEKEVFLKELQKRYNNNMLPPREWLDRYLSIRKMNERRGEYLRNRMQEVKEKENIVIGEIPHRKQPEKRVEKYYDPKTGLPSCVYGKYAPFVAKEDPNNMRHLKNMALKLKKPEENKEKERVVQI